jgi:hypothetical protein
MEESVEGAAVRRDVLQAFEYSYLHDDWVYPLADTLDGVTVEEALWTPGPETKCIWEIVRHMTVWTENIVERMAQRERGEPPGRPAEGAWPPLPDVRNDTAWESDQKRLWESLSVLRARIEEMPLPALLGLGDVGYSILADMLCRFTHNAYHIGQITKLRECRTAMMG